MAIDVKKWLAEKASDLGISSEEMAVAEKLVTSDRFRSDFVPLPDFHSALDKQRSKFEQSYTEVVDLNRQWQEAFERDYAPALEAVERLKKAGYDVSGVRIDEGGNVTNRGASVSLDDIQALIDQRLEPVRAGTVEWATFIADRAPDYREQFGKKLPVDEFRKFGYENRAKYPTLESAYEAFTAKDRELKEQKDRDDWRAAEREKIRLELQSSTSFPEVSGLEAAPAFLAADEKAVATDRDNRAAFAKQFSDLKVTL